MTCIDNSKDQEEHWSTFSSDFLPPSVSTSHESALDFVFHQPLPRLPLCLPSDILHSFLVICSTSLKGNLQSTGIGHDGTPVLSAQASFRWSVVISAALIGETDRLQSAAAWPLRLCRRIVVIMEDFDGSNVVSASGSTISQPFSRAVACNSAPCVLVFGKRRALRH